MKNCVKMWLLLAAFAAGMCLYAAPKAKSRTAIIPRSLAIVRLALVNAPRIGHDQQGSEKTSTRKWLQVRVSYQFNPSLTFKPYFTYDNMRAEIYMRVTPSNGTWRGLRWFTGTQYLYKVIPDGKNKEKHAVSFFMPPGLIHNYAKRNENALLKECEGIIFFYNGDRLLGRIFFSGSAANSRQLDKKAAELLAEYDVASKNPALLVKDGLWPREMTPWQHLDADRYDLPRPNFSRGNTSASPAPAPAASSEGEEEKGAEKKTGSAGAAEEDEDTGMKFTRSSKSNKKKSRGRK